MFIFFWWRFSISPFSETSVIQPVWAPCKTEGNYLTINLPASPCMTFFLHSFVAHWTKKMALNSRLQPQFPCIVENANVKSSFTFRRKACQLALKRKQNQSHSLPPVSHKKERMILCKVCLNATAIAFTQQSPWMFKAESHTFSGVMIKTPAENEMDSVCVCVCVCA